ncbi:MAG: sigma-54 interaction domain-containing protein [Proteocatella sp.]
MERNIKKAFDKMISQFATPALITTQCGKIIAQNSNIDDILEILGSDRVKNIRDIDETFGEEHEVCQQFFFKEVNLGGQKCRISSIDEEHYFMYVFDKRLSEERVINSVIEHIDEIVVIFDENGKIEKMNSLCDEILPFKKEDVLGKTIYDMVDCGEVKDPIIVKMLEAKEKVYQNTVYPSGKIIAYTAIPIFDSNDKLKGGVLTGRDISRIANLDKRKQLEKEHDDEEEFQEPKEYVSVSKEMKKVKKLILRAAKSDSAIFVTGETGVGKEVVARYIHNNSSRREKPFIAVNCGAIPAELIESELFGYEEGAFSGAKKQGKAGIIELVDGGTLFLDEIGELPYDMQKKLLRVIQENEVIRVGGVTPKKIDVRYVSATNISIEELHDPKKFRQDLYFRLSVIPIRMPPLRNRKDDIIPLCNHFLGIFNEKYKKNVRISKGVSEIMLRNPWLGNVRELKNLVERLVVLSNQDIVGVDQFEIIMNLDSMEYVDEFVKNTDVIEDFNDKNRHNLSQNAITINKEMTLDEAIKCLEQIMIKDAVDKFGSIQKAARNIGIDPSTIHRKIKSGQIKL